MALDDPTVDFSLLTDSEHPERSANSRSEVRFGAGELPSLDALLESFSALTDGLPEQIALLDEQWKILAANRAWVRLAKTSGYETLRVGANYLAFCDHFGAKGLEAAQAVGDGLREIDSGSKNRFRLAYAGSDRWTGRDFQICVTRLEVAGRRLALVTRYEITELVALRRVQQQVEIAVMQSQEMERQRLAREIHDSTAQSLTAFRLMLGQLKRRTTAECCDSLLHDMERTIDDVQKEIRTLSYLMHPPVISDSSLEEALRTLVEGFARRTGLQTSFAVHGSTDVISPAGQSAVYRLAQEALSNIHSHSRASRAALRVKANSRMLHAIVSDNGIGLPYKPLPKSPVGVGLSGMRSRLLHLGGRLSIRRLAPGTALIASLPVTRTPDDTARYD